MSTQYDVFISHKSERKPWVELLAKNLQLAGLAVFLDKWELVPGRSLAAQLDDGLRASRKGILVATPEIAGSAWIRREYDRMLKLSDEKPGFSFIPIRLGIEIAEMPFLSNLLYVDFPGPDQYRKSFAHLLAALRDKPPGDNPIYAGELEIPPANQFQSRLQLDRRAAGTELESDIFDKLQTRRAVLLCAQEDQVTSREKKRLIELGLEDHDENRVLRFALPCGADAEMGDFFLRLSQQCKFEPVADNGIAFSSRIRKLLEGSGQPLLLFIEGFEGGPRRGQIQLTQQLRSLHAERDNIQFLVFGGEVLADIYFSPLDDLSPLLGHADLVEWPELQPSDVQTIAAEVIRGKSLDDALASEILRLTGGHMRLVEYALQFMKSRDDFDPEACGEAILCKPYLFRVFRALRSAEKSPGSLREILDQNEIARGRAKLAGGYIGDAFVRRLYWQNLLKWQPGRKALAWRCELLREAGRQLLEIES